MKIAIIGCGNMGMAFARAFLKFDLVKNQDFLLVEKSTDRMDSLTAFQPGVITGVIGPQIGEYDLIIVSVKPQDFLSVASSLKEVIQPSQVVLSIMAGVTIEGIQSALEHKAVIRAMPNTPAMLGMGITAYSASPEVDIHQLRKIENLINATGRSVFLEDEDQLNAVTALSGSGPAYFFYVVKAMIEAGKQMGFEESVAALLVKQTMLGSYHLINNADKSLDDLIKAVASKGGTTEAALRQFEAGGLDKTLENGIFAAQVRSTELSKG
ncbi:pyrroline-5-carboxylate reductase [Dyadobacter fermentans]|uniref:Pyrroline-5-carboxylate reductase n=1 Tax=Dyadobacter fermentans (strain ATCC 700827 / DSM 18053 / CIP 107007 / KCTC 52180 / NS114) TaxID=471854 RepID=C6VTV4_DYAFD|nr:pyrroline-5-carboxylate reductase [Dyadobacter fermentans]ACT94722.1 pyrroline-5-carboxylate reductase [Dyadobacter fermentans DSM 18053]